MATVEHEINQPRQHQHGNCDVKNLLQLSMSLHTIEFRRMAGLGTSHAPRYAR
jgi:hypothetical protein